jgi:hypothetical protein
MIPLLALTAPESGPGLAGVELESEELLAFGERDGSMGAPHVSQ